MPVKMKILVIAMAVMCLMTCMCVTAFAAEVEQPPSTVLIQNGVEFDSATVTGGAIPAFSVEPGKEYTITGLSKFSRLFGISADGTRKNLGVTITDAPYVYVADGTYPYIGVDAGVSNFTPTTVTWEEPTLWGQAGMFVTGVMDNFGGPVLSFISSHALILIPALSGLCILGILVVRRFVYGA